MAEYNERVKKYAIVTVGNVDGEFVGDMKVGFWAELFETAGYGNLWDYYNATSTNGSGPAGEIEEAEDLIKDQIEALKHTAGVNELFDKLFAIK